MKPEKLPDNWPMKPGYYWARWTVPSDGTHEPDDMCWPNPNWEIVQVNENVLDWADAPAEDEALSVVIPGVRETQWRDCFIWGKFVADLDSPEK